MIQPLNQEALLKLAADVRLVIFDVDGVLTTGKLMYHADGGEAKAFHVHDGMGLRLLLKTGVQIGIITARTSAVVAKRMRDLNIEHVYQGAIDKVIAYDLLKDKLGLSDTQIAYVGDDLPDLPLFKRVGLSITVPNAVPVMREYAMHVTQARGGKGAAREVCELIMRAHNTYSAALAFYLNR